MKLNYKRTILIGMAFLTISAFWQMYDNEIPRILKNTFGIKETVTGAIMAADNVFALFLLPIFGAFSDKVKTRIGRRMPFILIGTLLSVAFLMLPFLCLPFPSTICNTSKIIKPTVPKNVIAITIGDVR